MLTVQIMLLLFTLFYQINQITSSSYIAPSECTFTHASQSFDIILLCKLRATHPSGLNFSLIQPDHTVSLTLICDANHFEPKITNSSFAHLRSLKSLTIEGCKLSYLNGLNFLGLDQLKNLTLRSKISNWNGPFLKLNHVSFLHSKQLELLDLSFNKMNNLPDDIFCSLANLKLLNLTHNRISNFGSLGIVDHLTGHLCLQELEELDMSYNRIPFLSKTGVASLKNLHSLFLQHNLITEVAEISLSALSKLRVIDLSSNYLKSLPSRLFHDSQELRELHLQNNSLSKLNSGLFTGLSKLVILNLKHNEITNDSITSETFVDLIRVVVLDLSYNRLARINTYTFQSQYSLQILFLNNNEIEFIEDNAFSSLYNLDTLILSSNKLKHLNSFTFNGLYVLSSLSLSFNELNSLDQDCFKNCSSLQDLHLSNNLFTSIPSAITNLRNLRSLSLNDNLIGDIDNESHLNLQYLVSLNFSGNSISNISRENLRDLVSLKKLDLSNNMLRKLEPGTFDDAISLESLYLQNNLLQDINGLFMNLAKLRNLNVSLNSITWFDFALIHKNVIEFDIHRNEIESIGNFYELQSELQLQMMDASFNKLTEIGPASIPNQIEKLILSNNQISFISPLTFMNKYNLSYVDLTHNSLKSLDINAFRLTPVMSERSLPIFKVSSNPFFCDCNMEWVQRINNLDESRQYPLILDLKSIMCSLSFARSTSYLPLIKANSSNFLCKYKTHCFALCHCCDFDACDCEMMCPDNCTCYYDQTWSTNIVDCSAKNYTNVPSRIPMDVSELYLDGNSINVLTSHTFIGRKNMKILYLNSSEIHSINNRTFNGLGYLQILHLEHNHITALNGFEFESLFNLKELHLNHNHISTINNRTFIHLRSLQVLHLEYNLIGDFNIWNFNHNTKLTSVYLAHNLWSCRCQFVESLTNWMKQFNGLIKDGQEVKCFNNNTSASVYLKNYNLSKCVYINEQDAYITSLQGQEEVNSLSNYLMQNYIPLAIFVILLSIALILIILTLCIYHKDLQSWIDSNYWLRFFRKSQPPPESEKLFDAFISYCKKDEAFISQILAPELECGYPSYRICLRYRDLPMTGYVIEAVSEAIESSHRTIILLSEQYLKSDSCLFELKLAHQECQMSKSHRLVFIVLDKNNLHELDSDKKMCLRSSPIVNWGDKRFWEKLRYLMPPGRGTKSLNYIDMRRTLDLKRAINHDSV